MNPYRELLCGELGEEQLGKSVKLAGWVHRRRDHGGVIFIDLRDHTGLVQLVFDPSHAELFEVADELRSEFVICVTGEVAARPPESINQELATGKWEVMGRSCQVLSRAADLPFTPKEYEHANEDLRLANRVIDLRRSAMQHKLRLRAKVGSILRQYLAAEEFVEVETPILTKETPEGARDYLVPSRTQPGSFFALPQSPQLFKQLLMMGGFNRYYQFARCFRDEDLRADRQPEFTQLDMELAFVSEEEVMGLSEEMIQRVFAEVLEVQLPKFPVMTYEEAMTRYGTDRPDLRSPLELQDITAVVKDCDFKVFSQPARAANGKVAVLRVPGGAARLSRKDIDDFTAYVGTLGAKGLAYIRIESLAKGIEGMNSPIIKFLGEETVLAIVKAAGAGDGDILFFGADKRALVHKCLGALRLELSHKLGLIEDAWRPVWITEFPMFEATEDGGITPLHHPFTAPILDGEAGGRDSAKASGDAASGGPEGGSRQASASGADGAGGLGAAEFDTAALLAMKSRAYDLVINGTELGGGSIRIHDSELQHKILRALKIEDSEQKFGFLLRSLKFGAPPHGGIAFGLDRLLMLIDGGESIRDYIAFPKTQSATCLLTEAPSQVNPRLLRDLGLKPAGGNPAAT